MFGLLWGGLVLIFYVHIFHPFLLIVAGFYKKTFRKLENKEDFNNVDELPSVSLLISAYNEEAVIEAKLLNSLSLEYPETKLEIFVVSDGSTDRTDKIVKRFKEKKVILNRIEGRKGKNVCQNMSFEKIKTDIIVFSDATSIYKKDAIKKLVSEFKNSEVGCVVGQLVYQSADDQDKANEEKIFAVFSQWVKNLESNASMPVGASGAIYALRRELAIQIPANMADDLIRPLEVIKQGYRIVMAPNAIAFEDFEENYNEIYQRKKRSGTRAILSLKMERQLLNPVNYGLFSIQFITKTLLRRLLFPSYCLVFLCSVLLYVTTVNIIYALMALAITLFCIGSYLGRSELFVNRLNNNKIGRLFRFMYYYSIIIYGAFNGLLSGLKGNFLVNWEPSRGSNEKND